MPSFTKRDDIVLCGNPNASGRRSSDPALAVPEPPQAAEFLQKRLISEFFGFQWQNLAEILSLFLGGHFGSFLAHFRSFGAIYGHFLAL